MPVPKSVSICIVDFITRLKHLHLFNTCFLTNWWICQWMNFNSKTQKQIRQKGRAAASEGLPRHGGRTQRLWVQTATVLRRFPFESNSSGWARSGSESRSNVRWNHKSHLILKLLVLKRRCVVCGFESQNHVVLRMSTCELE